MMALVILMLFMAVMFLVAVVVTAQALVKLSALAGSVLLGFCFMGFVGLLIEAGDLLKERKKWVVNSVFGEITAFHRNKWKAKEEYHLILWRKTYHVSLYAMANVKRENICEEQEISLKKFKDIVETDKKVMVEDFIMKQFKMDNRLSAAERFTPEEVVFTRKGDFAVHFTDNKPEEAGINGGVLTKFELSFIPKEDSCSQEGFLLSICREGFTREY